MARFEDKLVLSRWILAQFGADNFEALGNTLSADHLIGFDEEKNSKYLHELMVLIPENNRIIKDDQLQIYDDNIIRYWRKITNKRNHGGSTLFPLYFQYLSLLFTEHYLDRYFNDYSALCKDLNQFREKFNDNLFERDQIERFEVADLNKVAVWIATGGGKTLIMHVNFLQFMRYLKKARRDKEFNRTILLTPNEGLSSQHKEELDLSDIDADLFVKDGGNLFTDASINIIDIHKLKEKTGEKTVAVESFESKNLVLVDEGHRGAGGVDWIGKRNQLCENGFSFEYSATFGQAIKAANGSHFAPTAGRAPSAKYRLSQQYSRCILFDYSYKFFHGDGYGKDHYILNLSKAWTSDQVQIYLTGCILAFYQQKHLYLSKHKDITQYLLAEPLWIFVGGKVTAKNESNTETVSDIQAILRFISRFVYNRDDESVKFIEILIQKLDDFHDDSGRAVFGEAFTYLQNLWDPDQAADLFQDVLNTVFHAQASGSLHVVHLKGSGGEIGLRVGENEWFGLINVGDAAKLIKLCNMVSDDNMNVTELTFSESLFRAINKKDSSINLLVGAKKFTEGWSSWRVSTMGLMNVGVSEGSEIIQLFGRGVRLKGHNFTLKRSNYIPNIKHPENITLLETLNVFGIRSNYMKDFKEYLVTEGIGEEKTNLVMLPVIKRFSLEDHLKLIRLKKDIAPFKQTQRPLLEIPPPDMTGRINLNWYPKIQAMKSKGVTASTADNELYEGRLEDCHLAFLDFESIYFELVQYKNEKSWYNLQLDRKTIRNLLAKSDWYRLFLPKQLLEIYDFERVQIWQEIAITLLKKYIKHYYTFRKNEYEGLNLEYYEISETDDNFIDEYKATVDSNQNGWIRRLNELKKKLIDNEFGTLWSFGGLDVFDFSSHLYRPLIYFTNNEILKISPVPLNRGERDFVYDLKEFYFKNHLTYFKDKRIFLLRNQSRGKGIGFFEAGNFYPDFIIWILHGHKQHVCFVDPKGLVHVNGFDDPKVKFHKTIKKIQEKLGDPNLLLDAFIVSNTPYTDISWWGNGGSSVQDFANNHVLFQIENKKTYIKHLLDAVVSKS